MEKKYIVLPPLVLQYPSAWRLEKWLVRPDENVHKGQRVAQLRNEKTTAMEYAIAPQGGQLLETQLAEGELVGDQATVGVVGGCAHSVVYAGVCAVCGKDVSTTHFGEVGRNRAAERMKVAYADEGLRISRNEAEVMEMRNAHRLFEERRLSLVLDLDHTLVHATDDPRASYLHDLKRKFGLGGDGTLQGTENGLLNGQEDSNTREKSVLVKRSSEQCEAETVGEPEDQKRRKNEEGESISIKNGMEDNGRSRDAERAQEDSVIKKGKNEDEDKSLSIDKFQHVYPVLEDVHRFMLPNCKYPMFVKLRPGLRTFLKRCSQLFELHIYTMGTSAYAEKVASIIDPDKSLFAGRITSRDHFREGRFNQKNIVRLFPCDDSMVVIVDDREDVWLEPRRFSPAPYMPNLIKVRPYHFWTGLREVYDRDGKSGVQKGGQVKKKEPLANGTSPAEAIGPAKASSSAAEPSTSASTAPAPEKNGTRVAEKNSIKSDLEQGKLSKKEIALGGLCNAVNDDRLHVGSPPHLEQISNVLAECHRRFFAQSDAKVDGVADNQAVNESSWSAPADIKQVLDLMRKQVLKDCTLSFSRITQPSIPVNVLNIWVLAQRFGANCQVLYNQNVTHVVAHRQFATDSEASRLARLSGKLVVDTDWLKDSCESWSRQEEARYIVESTGSDAFCRPGSLHYGQLEVDFGTSNGEVGASAVENGSGMDDSAKENQSLGADGGSEAIAMEEDDDHSFMAGLASEMLQNNG